MKSDASQNVQMCLGRAYVSKYQLSSGHFIFTEYNEKVFRASVKQQKINGKRLNMRQINLTHVGVT